eukprot:2921034-Pleurochrysis_carterae.AAC.2
MGGTFRRGRIYVGEFVGRARARARCRVRVARSSAGERAVEEAEALSARELLGRGRVCVDESAFVHARVSAVHSRVRGGWACAIEGECVRAQPCACICARANSRKRHRGRAHEFSNVRR